MPASANRSLPRRQVDVALDKASHGCRLLVVASSSTQASRDVWSWCVQRRGVSCHNWRMRRAVYGVALTAVLLAVAGSTQAAATSVSARSSEFACPAARVRTEPNQRLGDLNGGPWIVASPRSAGIFAYLWGGDAIDGRAAVYAGGVNPKTGPARRSCGSSTGSGKGCCGLPHDGCG